MRLPLRTPFRHRWRPLVRRRFALWPLSMPRSGALPETCTVIPVLASSAPTSLAVSGDEAM
eukprot:3836860-Pyramimonas_sp.AAC.1